MATIITTDTTWTTDHTDASGYIIRGCTLTVDAVGGATSIRIIYGAGGAGTFYTEDDAKLKLIFNDDYKIVFGGASSLSQSGQFVCTGLIETDFRGIRTEPKCYIGIDGTNKISSSDGHGIGEQPYATTLKNIWFVSDYPYQVYNILGNKILFKNCKFGDGTESSNLGVTTPHEYWFEDCTFDSTTIYQLYNLAGGVLNNVGTQQGDTAEYPNSYLSVHRKWTRAYLRITDGVNPLSGKYVMLIDSTNKFCWSGITGADGKLDATKSEFGLNYLLAIKEQSDDWNGVVTYASPTKQHRLIVYNPTGEYLSYTTTHDMSSDWGASGSYVDIALTLASVPVITNPALTPDPISVNESLQVEADVALTDEAFVVFLNPDGSGEIIYSQHMFVSGGKALAQIPANSLVEGSYSAGKIEIKAIGAGASAIDATLTLTVNPKTLPDYEVYQEEVCERVWRLLLEYTDNNGTKWFEQFKSKIFFNAKKSIPTSKYPAMFIFIDGVDREAFAIKRQDWWVMKLKIMIYTLSHTEDKMSFHYKCVEGIDRVCRVNPHLHLEGQPDLSIHKADLINANYDFAFGDNFVVSETDCTLEIRTKLCLANQLS